VIFGNRANLLFIEICIQKIKTLSVMGSNQNSKSIKEKPQYEVEKL
jgi:hypothetical protein